MRVTFVNPVGVVGGGERVLLAILKSVPAAMPAFAPTVVLLADGPLAQAAANLGARVEICPLPPALAGLGDTHLRANKGVARGRLLLAAARSAPAAADFVRRLTRTLAGTRPDLIHSNGLKAHLLLAAARPRGVPVVWHLHDYLGHRPVGRRLSPLAASRGVRGAVAISASVGRDARAVLPRLTITTVLNAVDTDHFRPGPGDGPALDALAGLPPAPPGTVRAGLVATYADWKGHGVFLAALAARRDLPLRGYVVGGLIYATAGSQVTRAGLEAQVQALGLTGRVGFVPFRPDPAGVYRALDVVVHASTRPEPFGLSIAEAMSCGRAVVVAAAGGAVELFTDGIDAVGHPPGDAVALAEMFGRLTVDAGLRERLGVAARAGAVERFGLGRFGAEMAAVFRTQGLSSLDFRG